MKHITPLLLLILCCQSSCSVLSDISNNTRATSDNTAGTSGYLRQIESNTRPTDHISGPGDTARLLSRIISYDELYARNVINDSSWLAGEHWIGFSVKTIERSGADTVRKTFKGWAHAANPEQLYLTEELTEAIQRPAARTRQQTGQGHQQAPARLAAGRHRPLTGVTEKDWNELLMRERIYLDGFLVQKRNFNHLDLSRLSLSNVYLLQDTFYNVRALSSSTVGQASNSYLNMRMGGSVIRNATFKNWFFTSDEFQAEHWTNCWFYDSDLNDVSLKNIGIQGCTFDNVTLSNAVAGAISARFSNCVFNGGSFEDARLTASSFSSTKLTQPVNRGFFSRVEFLTGSGFRNNVVSGLQLDSCRFDGNAGFDHVTLKSVSFNNCHLLDLPFINQCILEDVKFTGTLQGMRLGNTIMTKATFGSASTPGYTVMRGADFRNAVFGQSGVSFIRCDLDGVLWPSYDLEAQGVSFVNCINEPH